MLILAVFCAAGAIISIPGLMIKSRDSNVSSVKSALLNPKYVPEVNEIAVSFPSGTEAGLTLRKAPARKGSESWFCTTESGFSFPANASLATQLIERASQTVSMAEVSDSYESWSALGLSDDAAVNIRFSNDAADGNHTTFSSLFFGYENADGSLMYVRNDRKSTAWRISSGYSSYMTGSPSFWADKHLLPVTDGSEKDDTRTCISYETGSDLFRIYDDQENSSRFSDMIHTLLSLRCSDILSQEEFSMLPGTPVRMMTVSLEGSGSSSPYGFIIYESEIEGEPCFFVQNYGIMSEGESPYYQVISTWTVSRITETLTGGN